jgi:hypothetical protein
MGCQVAFRTSPTVIGSRQKFREIQGRNNEGCEQIPSRILPALTPLVIDVSKSFSSGLSLRPDSQLAGILICG